MHPLNKRERFLISKNKGKRRANLLLNDCTNKDSVIERHSRLLRNTTKLCSCPMCGNARKHFNERTIQERRLAA